MVDTSLSLHDHGPVSVPAFRHWIHGFTVQTIVYGINIELFLMSIWVLFIHIIKGATTHRFHKHHLFQNTILLLYAIGMFALSSVFMGHQGLIAGDTWFRFFNLQSGDSAETIVREVFEDRAPLQRACNSILILANWGTVALLLWRCVLHWKVRSVFPSKAMALPYLLFSACIATGMIRIINDSTPQLLSRSTQNHNWALISWSISTALYYLLSFLIVIRVLNRRCLIAREIGISGVGHFTSGLTIFYESGVIVLAFSTAYLIVLARFPNLTYIVQSTTVQIQIMFSLIVVQRITAGKAWTGKTIDCLLHSESKHDSRHEEVSTMGFNPNTEIACVPNDYPSEHCSDNKGHHDLTTELREVIRNKV